MSSNNPHPCYDDGVHPAIKRMFERVHVDVPPSPTTAVYRHRKGGVYVLLDDNVLLEADGERAALYMGLDGRKWVRPWREFEARFTPLHVWPSVEQAP